MTPMPFLTKPLFHEPCNGCGLCCAKELCMAADEIFGDDCAAPCPALEYENGRAWCGIVRNPRRYIKALLSHENVLQEISRRVSIGNGMGLTGCDMPDDPSCLME
jgi:hypothetical protein